MAQAVKKNKKSLYDYDNYVYIDGYIRLIEGIILNALDKISISAKWDNRPITESMIKHKILNMESMREWINSENCGIWLSVYANETGRNAKQIRKSLKKILRRTTKYIKKLCKEKGLDFKKLSTGELDF